MVVASKELCPFCSGEGKTTTGQCSWCGGRGFALYCPTCHNKNAIRQEKCKTCHGKGLVRFCPRCHGVGKTFLAEYSRLAKRWETCRLCSGTGFLPLSLDKSKK